MSHGGLSDTVFTGGPQASVAQEQEFTSHVDDSGSVHPTVVSDPAPRVP